MEELIDVIDDNDNVIGIRSRSEVIRKHLFHRGVMMAVRDKSGRIFVHKRSKDKELDPSHFDMFFGGGVISGETFDMAAEREIMEEAGISSPKLKFLFKHKYFSSKSNCLMAVYDCRYDGKIALQEEEIEEGSFVTIGDLKAMLERNLFCNISLEVYMRYEKIEGGEGWKS